MLVRADPYIAPDFWRDRNVATLADLFNDIVLNDGVRYLGGHVLCGASVFVHDPHAPFPHVLPVLGDKVWGRDFDPRETSLQDFDPEIMLRMEEALQRVSRNYS